MNFESVFKRFFADWQKFLMMGVGSLLVNMAAGLIAGVLGLVLLGPTIWALLSGRVFGAGLGLASLFGFVVVAAVVGILGFGLSTAGLVGTVAAYRRNEPSGLDVFWSSATRNFGKIILLGAIFFGIMLVTALVNIIPILGTLVYMVWAALAYLTLFIYPSYLIISEGRDVIASVQFGFNLITKLFTESMIGTGIMVGFMIVLGIIGSLIPIIGGLVVGLFGQPLITFFFVERFEAEVRPKLAA